VVRLYRDKLQREGEEEELGSCDEFEAWMFLLFLEQTLFWRQNM
jgi:hypothetical protein